jgi:RHS repeat-associated protein
MVYDPVTLKRIQMVEDTDQKPTGWNVGPAPYLNRTTDYGYDDVGRRVEVLGQAYDAMVNGGSENVRKATWTVYKNSVSENQRWTGQGYVKTSDGSEHLISPVWISLMDKAGRETNAIVSGRSGGSGILQPTDSFLRSDWFRWTSSAYDRNGLKIRERVYYDIPTQNPDDGLTGVNSTVGTEGVNYNETQYGYDPATRLQVRMLSPGKTVTRTVYDGINRVQSTWIGTDDEPSGGNWEDWSPDNMTGTNVRKISEQEYDGGGDRADSNVTKTRAFVNNDTVRNTRFEYDYRNRQIVTNGELTEYIRRRYDNRGQVILVERFNATAQGNLIGKQETLFDWMGQTYRTLAFGVDPETGVADNALEGNVWYDANGNPVRSVSEGGGEQFGRQEYDHLDREVNSLMAYDDNRNEEVVETQETVYDVAGNVLSVSQGQRNTGAATLRTSYSAMWFDALGRVLDRADYGVITSFTRPAVPPARSDGILVTSTKYNDAGEVIETIDPKGLITTQEYDQAGRLVGTTNPANGKTGYAYNSDGQIEQLTDPESQTTTYKYGVTLADSGIASNDLLREVEYANGGTMQLSYNRQSENVSGTDQAGTRHAYEYDALGRRTADKVTVLGPEIDGMVRRIDTEYEVRGMVACLTSSDDPEGGGTIINQVRQTYNNFGQLAGDRQSHSGAVTTETPNVKYTYADGANDSNQIRPLSLFYPNGRELEYGYGPADGIDDKLNRVFELKGLNNTYARYQYLGEDTITRLTMPQPDIMLDLWGGTVGQYTGWDRFGRIINHLWVENGSGNPIQQIKHGYDRNSNKLYRRNEVARSLNKQYDWLYSYDDLNQLSDAERGTLNAQNSELSSTDFVQNWGYDQVGNWMNFNQGDDGNGTWELEQTRLHNQINEITNINASAGAVWATPQYDAVGNSTVFPNPVELTSNLDAVYDAWNRMVKISDGNNVVAEMQYDGRTHRTFKQEYENGVPGSVRHFYYTDRWQVIEERLTDDVEQSPNTLPADRQFVWGQYIDGLIVRDRDTTGNGTLNERLYAVQDSMYNVGTLVDASGVVQERIEYTPFGADVELDADFVPAVSSFYWETRFSGYRYEVNLKIYSIRYRWYHSQLGRWLIQDPIGVRGGLNLYAFAGNNGLKRWDASGLEWKEDIRNLVKEEYAKVDVHGTLVLGQTRRDFKITKNEVVPCEHHALCWTIDVGGEAEVWGWYTTPKSKKDETIHWQIGVRHYRAMRAAVEGYIKCYLKKEDAECYSEVIALEGEYWRTREFKAQFTYDCNTFGRRCGLKDTWTEQTKVALDALEEKKAECEGDGGENE